jgi:hypothetical protein
MLVATAITGAVIGYGVHRFTSTGSGRYLVRQGAAGEVFVINQNSGDVGMQSPRRL